MNTSLFSILRLELRLKCTKSSTTDGTQTHNHLANVFSF